MLTQLNQNICMNEVFFKKISLYCYDKNNSHVLIQAFFQVRPEPGGTNMLVVNLCRLQSWPILVLKVEH
jgi:hypothetical protein